MTLDPVDGTVESLAAIMNIRTTSATSAAPRPHPAVTQEGVVVIRWSLSTIAVLLGLILAGCAARGARTPSRADNIGVVRGTAAYRERVALPPEAQLEVWIADVSPLIMAVPLIAQTVVPSNGRQVPLPFELHYELGRIEPDHTYAVKAVIKNAGRILFATDTDYLVITRGNPTQVDLRLVRTAEEANSSSSRLLGTAWRLEDLSGAGVLGRVEATLEFPEAGRVVGNGSCNRFFGTVKISGESITFGPLASTRMGCVEAIGLQEATYLKALQDAERFTLTGSTLLIYSRGMGSPSRLIRKEP